MAILYLAELTLDDLLPKRGANTYPSGLYDKDQGQVKYGPKSTNNPTLTITDPIFDADRRNYIAPGFYELQLSYDRDFLIFYQGAKQIATVPVFKFEEDKSEIKPQPMDAKSQKKADKEAKKQEKKRKKDIKQHKIPEEPIIYNNATIEYDEKENYYLIKYERENKRAWGAIKQ